MERVTLAVLCLLWLAVASTGIAQVLPDWSATLVPGDLHSYLTIVARHHGGIADQAVTVLAGWGRPAVLRASDALPAHLRSLAGTLGPGAVLPLVFRVALLHTDAAMAARIPEMSADAVFHLNLVAVRLDPFARTPGCADFAEAWYTAAAGILTESSPLDAEELSERGLRLFPRSAGLQFAAGAIKEALANPDVQRMFRAGLVPRGRINATPTEVRLGGSSARLRRAERLFRGALAADPLLIEARVRLGRVLFDEGRLDEAQSELERARKEGGDRFVHYLALLFLGKVQQQSGRRGDARASYEAALDLEPDALAPRLALSRLLLREGQRVPALERLAPAMPAGSWTLEGAADPWIRYREGARRYVPDLVSRLVDLVEKAGAGRSDTVPNRVPARSVGMEVVSWPGASAFPFLSARRLGSPPAPRASNRRSARWPTPCAWTSSSPAARAQCVACPPRTSRCATTALSSASTSSATNRHRSDSCSPWMSARACRDTVSPRS